MPFVMKVFDPFTTYVSPFFTAVVFVPAMSLPAFGSVMAMAVMYSPVTIFGSQRAFWSSFASDR